jgi:hypothetical protein
MKWIALIFLVCASFAAFQIHQKNLMEAEAEAAEKAYREGRNSAADELARERAERKSEAEAWQRQESERISQEQANKDFERLQIAVTKIVEPIIARVQAPLDVSQPADMVPVIEMTKQRVLDKVVHAEPGQAAVYARATPLFNQLIAVAEERTKQLESLLRNRASLSSLNRPASTASTSIFSQNAVKKWDDFIARSRPATRQLLEDLRTAEREWNKGVDPRAAHEEYDISKFTPLMIPNDPPVTGSQTTSPNGAVSRPWRTSYYSSFGFRSPNSNSNP